MKQLFNHLTVFIIILNSGCGKQASFHSMKRPTRPSPAPFAHPIPSRPLVASNKQIYSLIAIPFSSTPQYTNAYQASHIEPLSMTRTPYIIDHTPSVVDLKLASNLYLDTVNINPSDMVHIPYMNSVNINASEATSLRPNVNRTISPIINITPSSFTSSINPVDINISEATSLRPNVNRTISPIISINSSPLISYMNPVDINISEATSLRPNVNRTISPIINITPSPLISYTNPVDINISEATSLRPNVNRTISPIINITPSPLISYTDPVDINISEATSLRPIINRTISPIISINSSPLISYMNPVDVNTSIDLVSLKSDISSNPLTDIKTPVHTSYMNQVHITTSETASIRPNIISIPPQIINTNLKSRTSYIDSTHISTSNLEVLTSNLNPTIQPTTRLIQPQNIPSVFNRRPEYKRNVLQSIDIQPDIQISSFIKEPPPKVIERKSQYEFYETFTYTLNEDLFFQSTYNKNKTTLLFQAFDRYGLNIRDLQKSDIILSENQIEIENYTFFSQSQKLDHKLEVVFAIDTGGSMGKYNDLIKENITYFVNKLEEAQIYTSFCLVTFKDLVEKHCDMFFPDNPLTPQTNENNLRFLNDISRLDFYQGGTYTQNALGAVLSASQAPWNTDSQRMIILITDALFWAKPLDDHPEARTAPEYSTTLDSVKQNKVQVFALTQNYFGFSKNYFEYPSLPDATSGEWLNIENLNNQDMNTIFNQVRDQIDITYKIEYFAEDQEELNDLLSLGDRHIALTSNLAVNTTMTNIQIENIHSNMPEGSHQLQSYWPLSQRAVINEDHVSVTVNEESEYNFFIEDGNIIFPNPPPSDSEILVQYEVDSLKDNVKEHPLLLQIDPKHQDSLNTKVSSISLKLNDIPISDQDFEITPLDSTDSVQLHLGERVFHDTDPYNIRDSGELKISFWYEVTSQHNSVN